jgi:hypothetical protein
MLRICRMNERCALGARRNLNLRVGPNLCAGVTYTKGVEQARNEIMGPASTGFTAGEIAPAHKASASPSTAILDSLSFAASAAPAEADTLEAFLAAGY